MNRNRRSRYTNSLGVPWVGFLVATGLVGLAFGFAYVYLMNQRHQQEGVKLALASEIRALVDEADTLGVEADTLAAPERLRPRLAEISPLLTAAPSRDVIVIKSPVSEPPPEGGG